MLDPVASSDIRLVVVDIDGTIAGHNNQVNEPVKKALKAAQAKGVRVGIATGHMYRSARRFHQDIGADMPLIAYQGAMIRDPLNDRLYSHRSLHLQMAKALMEFYAHYPLIVHLYIDDQLYLQSWNPHSQTYAERSQVPYALLSDLGPELTQEPTKVLAMTEDTVLVDHLHTTLKSLYPPEKLYLTKSVPTFLEATDPMVNKGWAVQYLAETVLGIRREQVMTIGDSYNDVEMLAYGGIGVAMGNAEEAVKHYADWIAPSVDQDGVVAALEQFVL